MKEVILSGATGLQSETLLKMNAFTRIFPEYWQLNFDHR